MPSFVEIVNIGLQRSFLNVVYVFFLFHFFLTFEKVMAHHLIKLESQSLKFCSKSSHPWEGDFLIYYIFSIEIRSFIH